ncbi:MAG: glycosyltransferase [Oscillospiraceae bacterium]|nr:glycosyltransferase [Oscillospiraceae bacterium]
MKVSVIIPTLNAERWIARQLDMLLRQTVQAEILVIDSGSTDATCAVVRARAERVRLLEIPRESFDHGGTRDHALRQSTGDYVCFLTQDALPTDERCLEKLLAAFSAPDVAAVFGRQIAFPDAPEYERLIRAFNYPDEPRVWREEDIPRYGVKAYFFSNACSAYRREAYLAVGGFDAPILSNEDMMMAAKLLHAGRALAYASEAAVYHSHRCTLRQEYLRNVRIGRVMEQYRDRLTGAKADAEGWRMLRFVGGKLAREGHCGSLPGFFARACVRFAGNRIGKRRGKRSGT